MLRTLLLFTTLFWLCVCKTQGQVQLDNPLASGSSIAEEKFKEHASIYEAFLSNILSWDNGDVIVRVEELHDTSELKNSGDCIVEVTKTYRIKFDHKTNRFLFAQQLEAENILVIHDAVDFDPADNRRSISQSGFCVTGEKVFIRKLPAKKQVLSKKKSVEEMCNIFQVPELRSVGLLTHGKGGIMKQIEKIVPKLASGHDIVKAKHTLGGNVEFIRHVPVQSNREQFFVMTVEFDTNSLMPINKKVQINVRVPEGGRELIPQYAERVEWTEMSGAFVPKKLTRNGTSKKVVMGQRFRFKKTTGVEYKWITLNGKLTDDDFNPNLLDDLGKFLRIDDFTKTEKVELDRVKQ